jgi:esterase/lipase superfamily enzyme
MQRPVRICSVLGLAALCACCNGSHPYRLEIMPPPSIYAAGAIASPDEQHRELRDGRVSLLYATSREPASEDDRESWYRNTRGSVLRLGVAAVNAAIEDRGQPDERMLLEVADAEELGVLPETQAPFASADFEPSAAASGPREFAAAVDRTLLDGPGRDVYIYVHGYKVVFESAVAVATEFWHYLDYEGAFIAFAWPSTPRQTAYFGDLETAEIAAVVLRRFLIYLSAQTQVRRIHIVGYSAGTRVVTAALADLALSDPREPSRQCTTKCTRIGQVALVGSDMDRGLMGVQLADGVLDLVDGLTIYVSAKDKALNFSRRIHGRDRAGQAFAPGQPAPSVRAWLDAHPELAVVDVSDAAESTIDNGHRYFRKSPWVSSDLLMMLRFGLGPETRGLVRSTDSAMWRFPSDYIERLSAAVTTAAAAPPAD